VRAQRRSARSAAALAWLLAGCGGAPPPEPDEPHDWLIVAETRIGPVTRASTEQSLSALLGPENVVRSEAHIGEGFCVPGSVLYPGAPDEVELLWTDTTYSAPAVVRVAGEGSRWRTTLGVGVGTSLAELEAKAGAPLEFSGFAWDYGGGASWPEPPGQDTTIIVLDLAPHPDSLAAASNDPRYGEILGDRTVRSDHPLMERLDVRVERISIRIGTLPPEHQCAAP
jgi:hypothetical protein